MEQTIVEFLKSKEDSLCLYAEVFPVESVESALVNLGFEYGEEQDSDGVRYSQFYHEALCIIIKQSFSGKEYELIKEFILE